jgi:hypothetical protein
VTRWTYHHMTALICGASGDGITTDFHRGASFGRGRRAVASQSLAFGCVEPYLWAKLIGWMCLLGMK